MMSAGPLQQNPASIGFAPRETANSGLPGSGEDASAPTDLDSFPALIERLRSGDDEAARAVFDRFGRRLVALARRRFDRRIAHRVDPEDVVQSAFKSFFVRYREGAFRLGDWDGLWGLLTLITRRKCADRAEYYKAARRDLRREARAAEGQVSPWELAAGREPRPEEAAAFAETVADLFLAVAAADRPILELTLQGHSAAEIGLRLGRALRSVQRVREQVHGRLLQHARGGLRAEV